jgi:hypothetical protein
MYLFEVIESSAHAAGDRSGTSRVHPAAGLLALTKRYIVRAVREIGTATETAYKCVPVRRPQRGVRLICIHNGARSYQNLAFSPLRQIDKSNAHDLCVACSLALPLSADEVTPLVPDGILFVESGASIQALSAPQANSSGNIRGRSRTGCIMARRRG